MVAVVQHAYIHNRRMEYLWLSSRSGRTPEINESLLGLHEYNDSLFS